MAALAGGTAMWKAGSSIWSFKNKVEEHLKTSAEKEDEKLNMLKSVLERLQRVEHEVLHNSGHSLKDMAARIEAKLDATLEWDDKGFFMCDGSGGNYWVNRTYVIAVGAVDKEALLGFNWISFVEDYDEYEEKFTEAFEKHRIFEGELTFKNGVTGYVKTKPTDDGGYIGSIKFTKNGNRIHTNSQN